MLALLIPGNESVTSENIDVYLAPLLEELLELWVGVSATDVSEEPHRQQFTLRALLLWCIHDYHAYGLTSGQVTKGYRACTECGPHVSTRRSKALQKNIYLGHRRSQTASISKVKTGLRWSSRGQASSSSSHKGDIKGYAQERDRGINSNKEEGAEEKATPFTGQE